MVIRDTAGLIIPLGLPLFILVMQAISIEDTDAEVAPGATVLDVYVLPVVLTMVVAIRRGDQYAQLPGPPTARPRCCDAWP